MEGDSGAVDLNRADNRKRPVKTVEHEVTGIENTAAESRNDDALGIDDFKGAGLNLVGNGLRLGASLCARRGIPNNEINTPNQSITE